MPSDVFPTAPSCGTDPRLKIAIGIATAGRAEVVSRTLAELRRQTQPADAIIICVAGSGDCAGLTSYTPHAMVITGPLGLPHQRNAILDRLDGFDVIVFLDDDFVPGSDYLAAISRVFRSHPDVALITGHVLADGVCGPGISHEEARSILDDHRNGGHHSPDAIADVTNGYGCNMAIRLRPVRMHQLRFDERLPLYAWLEDVDFSRRILPYGRIVRATAARGVHLGVKVGRPPGRRFGYSQVANPIYLLRKGTCPWNSALRLMSRNIAANLYGCIMPEPHVDRWGRVVGNVRAVLDLLMGRLHPSRALSL